MPELAINYSEIARITESGSAGLRNRLKEKGIELQDAPEEMEVEGGPAAQVLRSKITYQRDKSMPWDYYHDMENNCGPSCCSTILLHAKGVRMWPDAIADWMAGSGKAGAQDKEGYTSANDQVRFLEAQGIPTDKVRAGSLSEYRKVLRGQVDKGCLSIVLVYANRTKNTGGHFMVVYLVDEPDAEVGLIDPYYGTRPKWSWEYLYGNSIGGIIIAPKYSTDDYVVLKENWNAVTKTDVNARSGPSTRYSVVKVIPANTKLYLSKYTDQGQAVKGSEPERRWHYSERAGGWLFDGGLHQFERP